MANSPTSLCRKCLGFVSRLGSVTPQSPPLTTSGRGVGYPIPETSSKHHSVGGAVVIGASLAAMLGMVMLIALLMRRKIIRQQLLDGNAAGAGEGAVLEAKGGEGDAAQGENGKWSADAVELVVMAGEVAPTFVAHPVPAFSDSVVVQCPPFNLPKDPQ